MAFQIADRVKETTTTTGTGTLSLGGAVSQFITFVSGIGNGNQTYYSIEDPTGTDWEVGIGTVTSGAPDTLSRDTVISSSNAGSLVNFGAGSKVVFSTQPASKTVIVNTDTNVNVSANINATSFVGSGASLTSLNASNLASGTLPDARFPATLPAISGVNLTNLTNLDASNLASGTVPDARFPATLPNISGANLTNLNGSNVSSGTIADARLSANVTLNNASTISTGTLADGRLSGNVVLTSGATFTGNVALGDLDYVLMGPTGEYQIYHDHANGVSVIKDVDAGGSINMQADTINLTGAVVGSSTVNASTFNGSGAGLTTLNASNVSSGTLADARLTANVTLNNASTISAGTLADARLTSNVTLNNASTISAGTLADARLTSNVTLNNASTISAGTLADARLTSNVTLNNASTISAGTLADARLTSNVTLNNASTISTGTLSNARLSSIPNSSLANSSITINGTGVSLGGSINVGDITGVTAGSGLTGGGTTGDVTLNVGAGTGIDVAADAISVDVSDFMTNGSNNRVVTATGTDGMNAEANMTFDGSTLAVTGAITATGDITAFYTSDENLKTNITNIENPMDKVMELNGVYYDWTQEAKDKHSHLGDNREIGVIAQQVEKVLPEMVGTREDGTKAVRYERMCALLIECVKDLQNQVNELKGL